MGPGFFKNHCCCGFVGIMYIPPYVPYMGWVKMVNVKRIISLVFWLLQKNKLGLLVAS